MHIQGLKQQQDINDSIMKNINTCVDDAPIRIATIDSMKQMDHTRNIKQIEMT